MGADDEGEGEGVPVLVFVGLGGGIGEVGFEGVPVAAVVGGDVGAVGAYGDPGFGGGVVGYGAAIAVGGVVAESQCWPPSVVKAAVLVGPLGLR